MHKGMYKAYLMLNKKKIEKVLETERQIKMAQLEQLGIQHNIVEEPGLK
jgi:hypothetical protein